MKPIMLESIPALAVAVCLATVLPASTASADPFVLWQIGQTDHNNQEFALAPGRYHEFNRDGFFVVGSSDSRRDWPYVQPGPIDAWAGSRAHTFIVLFGLKQAPAEGECRLCLDLVDTQAQQPPRLQIGINGKTFDRTLSPGAGDASVNGQPSRGKPSTVELRFPAKLLQPGDNEVQITTQAGSWLLYDALRLETPTEVQTAPVTSRTVVEAVEPVRALKQADGKLLQPVRVTLRQYGEPIEATIRVEGAPAQRVSLAAGIAEAEMLLPAVTTTTQREVVVEVNGRPVATRSVNLQPVKPLTVYVLPHSHTDIGYTEIQTAIEAKQVSNLVQGIAIARRTADYPPGARFVWNVEVLWAADLYLHRLSGDQRADFFRAVKQGQVALNGMYLNELTGLCRPEELVQLFRYSTRLAEQCGVTIDSAMISDVPGYTWGTVTAMAQAGIKYFSAAPNYFDRIGDILVQWENKPFYWVGPSGREKVLVWIPYRGYALSHIIGRLTTKFVADYQAYLDQTKYPYEIAYLRWSGHGDNAVPDPEICEFIKVWNTKYAWPKFIIASTSDAFRAFESRYGAQLPRVRGDWTPYWEDGAGSSAVETALNRASSDRLTQAAALWAILNPKRYPWERFAAAWRNVLLYSEHTWGAWCSVSDPENKMTKEQWAIKQSYALQAAKDSHDLLEEAALTPGATENPAAVDIWNTCSWARTDLVVLPARLSAAGDQLSDEHDRPVPSQRLSNGTLVFVARNVPPFAARRFRISAGKPTLQGQAHAAGASLDNGLLRVRVDEVIGGIAGLRAKGIANDFVDTGSGECLNDYLFLPGNKVKDLQRNGPAKIRVKEPGPLLASLLIESEAPGSQGLAREVALVSGLDYVLINDVVNKTRAPISPKPGDHEFSQKGGKESVNFAFPFHVQEGELRLDVPLGVMRPELDQMPSACKNWFTVGRWADVANRDYGITWVTLDAPLVEVGGITATLVGSQANPEVWRKHVAKTQHIYSWAMNNHWGTNYRAYQEGPIHFGFALRPHRRYDPAEATRLAVELSQPLLPVPATAGANHSEPRLRVEPASALVTALKPADDGKGLIIRLFGPSDKASRVRLVWADPQPVSLWLSDTGEKALRPLAGALEIPAHGLVTLRAEMP